MDIEDPNRSRLIGDYILGPRIGFGSFAVVWRATHRQSGALVAVKEIDKKQLNLVVNDNLMREISILRTIDHPNIIRLFEAIQTEDRIYLVLEYCGGGDLAGQLRRHGKVSEAVARHFMRQLAAGLQVLNEKHLIHRDLKPQNLLLSNNEMAPLLKIGDFGFARYLKPQGLADTLCGSPLYMAPEIIQNQKYDAKADLWSVGAILYQLVIGKPPFDGNSQLQLFQNILASSELRFPQGALEELHPDCVDLCRSLLRQNPVERLSFQQFFNHKFLGEPKGMVDIEQFFLLPRSESITDENLPYMSGHLSNPSNRNLKFSSVHDGKGNILHGKDHSRTCSIKDVHGFMSNTACAKSVDGKLNLSCQLGVADSMESFEKEYVLVNAHFASADSFSSSLVTSVQENSSAARVSICRPNDKDVAVALQTKELTSSCIDGAESYDLNILAKSSASTILRKVQGLSILHPSTRLQLLHQYITTLSELAQEKLNAGLFLESFSVDLVVLAIWKEVVRVCSSWVASSSSTADKLEESRTSVNSLSNSKEGKYVVDFCRPCSVSLWAEQGFIRAFDRADKLSLHLRDMDGNAEMPDAMEIIFQAALAAGKSGAVDEYMGNRPSAAAAYSRAKLLLSFIVGEATSLPLNPPFSLTCAVKERIDRYIINLESHRTHSQLTAPLATK